jgi:hypothetical protein
MDDNCETGPAPGDVRWSDPAGKDRNTIGQYFEWQASAGWPGWLRSAKYQGSFQDELDLLGPKTWQARIYRLMTTE